MTHSVIHLNKREFARPRHIKGWLPDEEPVTAVSTMLFLRCLCACVVAVVSRAAPSHAHLVSVVEPTDGTNTVSVYAAPVLVDGDASERDLPRPAGPLDDIRRFYMGAPNTLPAAVQHAVGSALRMDRVGRGRGATMAAASLLQTYSADALFASSIFTAAAYNWCVDFLDLPDSVCYTATTNRARALDLLLMALCAGAPDMTTCRAPKDAPDAYAVPPRIHNLRQLMRAAATVQRTPAMHRVFNATAVCERVDFTNTCRAALVSSPTSIGKTLLLMTTRPETFEEAFAAIKGEVSSFVADVVDQLRSITSNAIYTPRHGNKHHAHHLPHAVGSSLREYVDRFASGGRLGAVLQYLMECIDGFSEDADGPYLPASRSTDGATGNTIPFVRAVI